MKLYRYKLWYIVVVEHHAYFHWWIIKYHDNLSYQCLRICWMLYSTNTGFQTSMVLVSPFLWNSICLGRVLWMIKSWIKFKIKRVSIAIFHFKRKDNVSFRKFLVVSKISVIQTWVLNYIIKVRQLNAKWKLNLNRWVAYHL